MRLLFLFFAAIILNLFACRQTNKGDYINKGDTSPPLDDSISKKIMQRFAKLYQSPSKKNKANASLSNEEIALLKDGDIILRKGFGTISDFISIYLNETYPVTHCAFYLYNGLNNPMVLHTVSNDSVSGMFTEPLKNYIHQSQSGTIAVVRLKGTDNQKKGVLNEAKRLLKKEVPFDMAFNDYDSTHMYCAEMMCTVFRNVYQKDLLPERAIYSGVDVIRMRNFFNPDNFDIIFNQFDSTEIKIMN
ncbi:MAG: hypothetical protein MK207_09075 [Saprospiraceae bacterium]|nr:hypothetical protein [Saprospiraceae bacterium]